MFPALQGMEKEQVIAHRIAMKSLVYPANTGVFKFGICQFLLTRGMGRKR